MSSPFRVETGQLLFRGLFYETTLADKSSVVYTLKRHDHVGYPSLYRLYMEMDDLTEYNFAISYTDGWDHWEQLCECTWFKPFIAKWRREIEIKRKAHSLLQIIAVADNPDSKESYQAQKFLISGGWKDKNDRKGAGRPSKEEVSSAARKIAQDAHDLNDDLARVQGLN